MALAQGYRCSTPCGIRGYGMIGCAMPGINYNSVLNALRHQRLWHASHLIAKFCATSAQRLAASEVMACALILMLFKYLLCSTPCGIRGYGISSEARIRLSICCAQRLAASEVMACLLRLRFLFYTSCAQRLAASEVMA